MSDDNSSASNNDAGSESSEVGRCDECMKQDCSLTWIFTRRDGEPYCVCEGCERTLNSCAFCYRPFLREDEAMNGEELATVWDEEWRGHPKPPAASEIEYDEWVHTTCSIKCAACDADLTTLGDGTTTAKLPKEAHALSGTVRRVCCACVVNCGFCSKDITLFPFDAPGGVCNKCAKSHINNTATVVPPGCARTYGCRDRKLRGGAYTPVDYAKTQRAFHPECAAFLDARRWRKIASSPSLVVEHTAPTTAVPSPKRQKSEITTAEE